MAECEVKVWGDWKRLTLAQALELDPSHLKRCPECHGQVRLHKASIDGMVVHFEHYERNRGCSLGDAPDIGESVDPVKLRPTNAYLVQANRTWPVASALRLFQCPRRTPREFR
jgi:hypothetical protein